jgi:hypothetical protein
MLLRNIPVPLQDYTMSQPISHSEESSPRQITKLLFYSVRSDVLTTMTVKSTVFCIIAPYSSERA